MARVDGHRAGCVCWQCDRAGEELAKHTAEIERLRIERDDAIRRGGEWARKATEEAECNKPLRAEIERLTGQLAECYRLTGADPDGNEDWRLAPQAVVEVKRLREQADAEIERLQRENAAAHLEADRIGREYAVLGSERDRLKAKLAAAEAAPYSDIRAERSQQDKQWGGQEHDDEHRWYDWTEYIEKQCRIINGPRTRSTAERSLERRQRFVKIAALAVAAIESQDRKRAPIKWCRNCDFSYSGDHICLD